MTKKEQLEKKKAIFAEDLPNIPTSDLLNSLSDKRMKKWEKDLIKEEISQRERVE